MNYIEYALLREVKKYLMSKVLAILKWVSVAIAIIMAFSLTWGLFSAEHGVDMAKGAGGSLFGILAIFFQLEQRSKAKGK